MSGRTLELPLFPLKTVLFPNMSLPIHVFENRYKTMIGSCIEESRDFGVVLIKSGAEVGATAVPHEIGTTAHITDVARLDDGQMYIATLGVKRFRILALKQEIPYLLGEVQVLDETEDAREPVALYESSAFVALTVINVLMMGIVIFEFPMRRSSK